MIFLVILLCNFLFLSSLSLGYLYFKQRKKLKELETMNVFFQQQLTLAGEDLDFKRDIDMFHTYIDYIIEPFFKYNYILEVAKNRSYEEKDLNEISKDLYFRVRNVMSDKVRYRFLKYFKNEEALDDEILKYIYSMTYKTLF